MGLVNAGGARVLLEVVLEDAVQGLGHVVGPLSKTCQEHGRHACSAEPVGNALAQLLVPHEWAVDEQVVLAKRTPCVHKVRFELRLHV